MSDDFCFYQVCLVLPFSRMSFDALNLEILPDMFIQAQYLFNHFLHTILELEYAKKALFEQFSRNYKPSS